MNINEIFRRINAGIAQCKEEIQHDQNEGKRIHMDGIATGLSAALKVINDVNFDPPMAVSKCKCLGWGSRKGKCGEPVPNKFLYLYCDLCHAERYPDSKNIPVEDECVIIPFKVHQR